MKREITLLLYTESYNDKIINELKEFCEKEGIPFEGVGERGPHIYDFVIEGDTKDYKKISEKFGDKLRERYFAELGNILDVDQETFDKWQDVLNRYRQKSFIQVRLLEDLCELIMKVDDSNKLFHLLNYQLDDTAKDLIMERIHFLNNEKGSYEKYLEDCLELDHMIKNLKLAKEGKYELKDNDIDSLINMLERKI